MDRISTIIIVLMLGSAGSWYISKSLTDADRRAAAERSLAARSGETRAQREKVGLRPVRTDGSGTRQRP